MILRDGEIFADGPKETVLAALRLPGPATASVPPATPMAPQLA
jgi:hypothetical protein